MTTIQELPGEITCSIFDLLDKESIFNYSSADKSNLSHRLYAYKKYKFDDDKITNNEIRQFIRRITCSKLNNLTQYHNLESLEFRNQEFNEKLPTLPSSLKNLTIGCPKLNQPIETLPELLESLNLICLSFNQQLDLPKNLKVLCIYSTLYTHKINLPPSCTDFSIMCFTMSRQTYNSLPKNMGHNRFECYSIID